MTLDRIAALVPEEQVRVGKYEVPRYDGVRARLDANESPYVLDADVAAELGHVLAGITPNRYPDSEASELRRAVCEDLGVAPDQLVFGNGSHDLINLVLAAFSRPRPEGDGRVRVLYPVPSFVGYPMAARLNRVKTVEVPLREDFELDTGALDRALAETRPNVAFFGLPNNPTGTLWPRAEILRIVEHHPDVIVVADEAYFEYSGETLLDALADRPNLIVMRTLSKLGLAGIRLGFLAGTPEVVAHVDRIRPPYNVGVLNQAAGTWLLAHHKQRLRDKVATVVRERERLVAELSRVTDMRVFPSRANYLLCRYGAAGDHRATQLCTGLEQHGVVVRNFDGPGLLSGCFRVTVGTPEENTLFLDAVRAFTGL
jgi:histidinol-phosphate aminotransferase